MNSLLLLYILLNYSPEINRVELEAYSSLGRPILDLDIKTSKVQSIPYLWYSGFILENGIYKNTLHTEIDNLFSLSSETGFGLKFHNEGNAFSFAIGFNSISIMNRIYQKNYSYEQTLNSTINMNSLKALFAFHFNLYNMFELSLGINCMFPLIVNETVYNEKTKTSYTLTSDNSVYIRNFSNNLALQFKVAYKDYKQPTFISPYIETMIGITNIHLDVKHSLYQINFGISVANEI